MRQGSHGIDLFFILSGFCLAYPFLAKLDRDGATTFNLARYAANRLVRIVPPYYIAILALVAFSWIVHRDVSASDVLRYAFFIDIHPPQLNSSFWTLPVEFRWYFLFPVLLFAWVRWRIAFAIVAIAALLLTFTPFYARDVAALPGFMLGIVAADLTVRRDTRLMWLAGLAFPALLTLSALRSPQQWLSYLELGWQLTAFALVLASARFGTRILASPLLRAVGVASYGIYLVHEPLITYFESHGVAVPLAIAIGFAFWYVAERPFAGGALRPLLVRRIVSLFENRVSMSHDVSRA
jgi:peptidoglycan/LPS O-acetylase OafA/YrhL